MPRDDEHIARLTKQAHAIMEGEKLSDVMMVSMAVLVSAIKQASPDERKQLVPFMDAIWQKLTEVLRDAS